MSIYAFVLGLFFLDVFALVGLSLNSRVQRLWFSVNELFGGCPLSQVCADFLCRDLPSRFGQELHHEYWGDGRVSVCLSPRLQLPGGSELLQHHQGGRGKCWPSSWVGRGGLGKDLGGVGRRMNDTEGVLLVGCKIKKIKWGRENPGVLGVGLGGRMPDTEGVLGCHLQKKVTWERGNFCKSIYNIR